MYKIVNQPHAGIRQLNPEQSEELVLIVNKLLENNGRNRYQTGQDVVNDLKKCHVKAVTE
jgi:hypothetical protein